MSDLREREKTPASEDLDWVFAAKVAELGRYYRWLAPTASARRVKRAAVRHALRLVREGRLA